MVPVFYNGLPAILIKNVMQATVSKGLIDLAGGMGEGCKASMALRKPCLALCLSEAHMRLLFDHLVDWMLTTMLDQTSVFYNQAYKTFNAGAEIKALPLPLTSPTKPADLPKKRSNSAKNKKPKKRRKSGGKRESSSSDSSSAD